MYKQITVQADLHVYSASLGHGNSGSYRTNRLSATFVQDGHIFISCLPSLLLGSHVYLKLAIVLFKDNFQAAVEKLLVVSITN